MNINLLTIGEGPFPDDRANVRDTPPVRDKCELGHFQISHFQVGSGASGVPETSGVVSLGAPLSDAQYGSVGRSVDITSGILYEEEGIPLGVQDFVILKNQGILGTSSLVSVVFLDEQTANGHTINEVGLFVDNPFLSLDTSGVRFRTEPSPVNLLGGNGGGTGGGAIEISEVPGHLLAAYRHISPIKKENYFSLLIRWSINFSLPRV